MRGCFGGFWRRRVRLTGWRSGFRATVCRCAGRPRCTGWRVRILWCRSIFEGGGRGGSKPLFFCLSEPADIFVKRTQTTQTRLTAQQRVALAYGELLPQPRLSVASSLYQKRPQSGCGSSPPSGGSDWAQQPKAASVQSVFFFQIRSKMNQSLPFLSLSTSNTIIREERADKKSPCSL